MKIGNECRYELSGKMIEGKIIGRALSGGFLIEHLEEDGTRTISNRNEKDVK